MAQIELTESDNELPRKLAAILQKGTRHPDYFTLDGLKSEVWPVSRRLFDILEAAITERISGIKLDRTEPRESPVKKGRQVLDSLSVTLTNMDPTLYLGVNIGMDDREEELSHRLTWGVSAWGGGEQIKKIAEMVKSLGLKEHIDKVRVFKSPLFGGANFFLGNDLSPDGLENQPLAQLIDQIVNDLDALFGRFKSREKEVIATLTQAGRYWKISPGERAEYWNEFQGLSCIALGWSRIGDLRRFKSQGDIKDFITRERWEGSLSHISAHLWWLSHEMQIGDIVFAYGSKTILGMGRITGEYQFTQDSVMDYAHRRPVQWVSLQRKSIDNLPQDLQQRLMDRTTIIDLSQEEGRHISALYGKGPGGVADELQWYFMSRGLHFTLEQLATFYTALKTKGFVILTGISGTGKTKLAQYFAELFPAPERNVAEEPEEIETVIHLQIQPYMLKYTRLIVPKSYWKLLDVPAAGETSKVELTFDGKSETCNLTHASYGGADYLQILFRGKARKWLTANFHENDILILEPAFSDEGDFSGFHLREPEARQVRKREPNFYFASVRPDWKDSKSLLGYYNPLSEQFESTGFLRFVLKAHQDLAVPYFVLLDEMNLAKVEYYFADFLSVLESGRREDSFTKEAIRFQYPEGIDGPPRELCLSPNLYFIGTVNVDETTYMFSPKVLDRAFTLELSEVDFAYPSEQGAGLSHEELEALQAQFLPDFTNQGRFAVVDKAAVTDFVQQYPIYREHLSTLNALLQPHDLHFGYRVFDEIMMFLANAEGSPVFDGFGPDGLDAAFDAAVLMKVLPKFHGTRGKLGEPLEKMVGWAREPDNPEAERHFLSDRLQDAGKRAELREGLRKRIEGEESSAVDAFAYPRTALKALRMLHDLYTTGFASFA